MRILVILSTILALTACGGSSHRGARNAVPDVTRATGPISRACLAADRDAATPQLCGCVQAVANQTLSDRDRSRVVTFFQDPERAHEVKISDTTANDAFWDRYRDFIAASRQACG